MNASNSQMFANILEQPIVAQHCLDLPLHLPEVECDRILWAACGSSRHVALVAQLWTEQWLGIPSQVFDAGNWTMPVGVNRNCLSILLSQSGMTQDVLAVADALKSVSDRPPLWGITNGADTKLHAVADLTWQTPAGEEKAVAATKTLLAQLILSARLIQTLAKSKSKTLEKLPELIERTIQLSQSACERVAQELHDRQHLILLGSGVNYPNALEGALKLKETCYLHAEGQSDGDFMHGPIAIIEPGFPVILIAIPGDLNYANTIAHAKRIKSYGAYLIGVTTQENPDAELFEVVLPIAAIEPILSPILTVIPLQLLACYLAIAKGLDTDKPRNLTKFIG
jgi:glucosamine 6-phosphate synthetase-like amidotransferase/phosphosugar isomerase protein